MKFSEGKLIEYTVYVVFIALVLVVVYQVTSTHRIALLQRPSLVPDEQPADDNAAPVMDLSAEDAAGA